MPKPMQEYQTPPIIFQRFKDEFAEFDYGAPLNGPFELANPIQAMQLEAAAKGKGIIVQAALCDLKQFFGTPEEGEPDDRPGTGTSNPGTGA